LRKEAIKFIGGELVHSYHGSDGDVSVHFVEKGDVQEVSEKMAADLLSRKHQGKPLFKKPDKEKKARAEDGPPADRAVHAPPKKRGSRRRRR
jgi:topoisomerase IA-like protein